MRYLIGILGVLIILFGSLLMSITSDTFLERNILYKLFGAIIFFVGLRVLQKQIHQNKH
ncbi:hypothetical protein FJQ98_11865 [Lysinibacillus agricola]|uniref:Uncharacterized protein n=1 Tax=Lysinibacillus agricola TaxID=2590012 RepID=A0ABX7AXU6_9BACI|nr:MULTISPECIES: hypothetical protein [Lysinibacillus]QQP14631.1 hypothetical protein FJQ98_11865 [Lysinibacillus agricola]